MGAAENWALDKALSRWKVCHLGGAFQAPCFFCLLVGKPAQASPIFASGEQLGIIFRCSSDWEGGGAQPPDLQASAGLSSEALSSEAARMA